MTPFDGYEEVDGLYRLRPKTSTALQYPLYPAEGDLVRCAIDLTNGTCTILIISWSEQYNGFGGAFRQTDVPFVIGAVADDNYWPAAGGSVTIEGIPEYTMTPGNIRRLVAAAGNTLWYENI